MSSQLASKVAFGVTGAAAFGTSWIIFRDLTDFSQWIVKRYKRDDFFQTFKKRNELTAAALASMAANTGIVFKTKCVPKVAWAAVNAPSLFMIYMGYVNPEIMMRAKNKFAMYVPTSKALEIIEPKETVIVTKVGHDVKCFPDTQIVRPHVARVGILPNGNPATMTYCGLTGTGIVYETPDHPDGSPVEFTSITQLENNLILLDKTTGHLGHQINGLDETALLEKLDGKDYEITARRPSGERLKAIGMDAYKEVPTWRMTMRNFDRTYPDGQVFINDYKEYRNYKRPVLTIYDTIIDTVFANAIHQHNVQPEPIFPTVENISSRLRNKERVWGFNVGDDYACVTESFVRDGPNHVRNLTLGGVPLVAAWDPDACSLGIWKRKSSKPITQTVDVHGRVGGKGEILERLETVKNGLFWFVWQNFFPKTTVNPES